MTDQEINIAIAEACGWKFHPESDVNGNAYPECWTSEESDNVFTPSSLPKYASDLNAMHEAEEVLTDEQKFIYWEKLGGNDLEHMNFLGGFFLIHAAARQRAEAFLRTIGKWRDA